MKDLYFEEEAKKDLEKAMNNHPSKWERVQPRINVEITLAQIQLLECCILTGVFSIAHIRILLANQFNIEE